MVLEEGIMGKRATVIINTIIYFERRNDPIIRVFFRLHGIFFPGRTRASLQRCPSLLRKLAK